MGFTGKRELITKSSCPENLSTEAEEEKYNFAIKEALTPSVELGPQPVSGRGAEEPGRPHSRACSGHVPRGRAAPGPPEGCSRHFIVIYLVTGSPSELLH